MKAWFLLVLSLLGPGLAIAAPADSLVDRPQVQFQTNMGEFVMELYPDKAPKTVENFLRYIKADFYTGTIFHRVMKNFMIQGGGYADGLLEKSTYDPIVSESNNGLKNELGTVAMARAFAPDSATSQFFVNLSDNKFLNFYKMDPHYMGYCVFGKVIRGLDVIEKIGQVPTQVVGKHLNVPLQPVVVEKVVLLDTPVEPEKRSLPSSVPTTAKDAKPKDSKTVTKGKKRG